MSTKVTAEDCPIIALDRFIQATRDSGYKGTASAVSELIDNSLQAGADEIQVMLAEVGGEFPVDVKVVDNGCGMDPFTLRQALRFGGSSRFGDRSGLGRYGMGLPNSSLSQASRVTVYTWQKLEERANGRNAKRATPEEVYFSYLDVDEIASGALSQVPIPHKAQDVPPHCLGKSGTLVHWERCDRLDNRRISTLAKKLSLELGKRFRHFIWDGVRIEVNGDLVKAIDPLFLRGERNGAEPFGEELMYEIFIDPSDKSKGTSVVRVRFSELPVHEWQALSNDEKRDLGITKGAGVSIIRGGREVDYGWFFIEKRRENYDDWWRCEVRFEPALDEAPSKGSSLDFDTRIFSNSSVEVVSIIVPWAFLSIWLNRLSTLSCRAKASMVFSSYTPKEVFESLKIKSSFLSFNASNSRFIASVLAFTRSSTEVTGSVAIKRLGASSLLVTMPVSSSSGNIR